MKEDSELKRIREKKMKELIKHMSKEETSVEVPTGVQNLTSSNFDEIVTKSSVPVIVDFWAAWCMPCQVMGPIFDSLAKKYAGKMVFGKVNVDENPKLATQFGASSIPTFIIFKGGKPVERIIGAVGPQLEEPIKKHV
ncbi:MAG: thioredoxin [Candidatus Hodarchaeota archaeon]